MGNKKFYIYVGIAFVVGVLGLFAFFGVFQNKEKDKNFVAVTDDCIIDENSSTKETSTESDKISPNAKFIFKIKYSECEHIVERENEVEKEDVNLTKAELESKYSEWIIEKFSPEEIVLVKEENGLCNEHYVLKINDEAIAVYKNEFEEEELIKLTNIAVKYLPDEDISKLNVGIEIYGKEELSKILEDYGNK